LQLAASTVLLDVDLGIRQALAAPLPRLLDEWKVESALWNQVRRAVDAVDAPGQFMLTDSANHYLQIIISSPKAHPG
jgi:hypothetical protein